MNIINNVLSTWTFSEENIKRIENIVKPAKLITADKNDKREIEEALKFVDVAFLWNEIDDAYVQAPNLKWIQFAQAGLEQSLCPELFDKKIKVTSGAGCSITTISEHAMFFILSLGYNSMKLFENQKQGIWNQSILASQFCINGKTLGIIGYGNIGKKVAKIAKQFGMKVIAYNRSQIQEESNLEKAYSREQDDNLDELLAVSDYVLLSTNLSKETYHMIGKKELTKMKESAYIVNIARGSIIDENMLIEALKNGNIAGAALDTTEQEPLPKDNPLWTMSNVILTPHWSPSDQNLENHMVDLLEENVKRYQQGKPLINQVSKRDILKERL